MRMFTRSRPMLPLILDKLKGTIGTRGRNMARTLAAITVVLLAIVRPILSQASPPQSPAQIQVPPNELDRKIITIPGYIAPWDDDEGDTGDQNQYFTATKRAWWGGDLLMHLMTDSKIKEYVQFNQGLSTDLGEKLISFPYPCLRAVNPETGCDETDYIAFSYSGEGTYTGPQVRQALDLSAQQLSAQFKAYAQRYPDATFDLIGHSLGGVVATYWAAKWADDTDLQKVHSIITLDSPVQGYVVAPHWLVGDVGKDVTRGSEALKAIAEVGKRVNLVNIRSTQDQIVPDEIAVLTRHWRDLKKNLGWPSKDDPMAHGYVLRHPASLQEIGQVVVRSLYDDTHQAVQDAGWSAQTNDFVRGTQVESNVQGQTVTFTFTGSGITWYFSQGRNRGKARISVDGEVRETINLFRAIGKQRVKWAEDGLDSAKEHTVRIEVTGEKGVPGVGDTYVDLDAFEVRAPLLSEIPPTETPMERGLEYLRQRHKLYTDGSWSNDVGITSLAALAFLGAGFDETDPDVKTAIQFILSKRQPDGSFSNDPDTWPYSTYFTALALLALNATHNPDYSNEIEGAKTWLVNSQWDEDCLWESVSPDDPQYGGFGYGRSTRPDLSNTQFALLALDAAGLPKHDPTWAKVVTFVSRTQNRTASNDGYQPGDDGGFIYLPGSSLAGGTRSYGSMTAAGIWGLALSGLPATDPRFAAALNWIEANYTFDANPGMPQGNSALYYYYLTVAKALTMARKTTVGERDWYKDLSVKLASFQQANGSWVNSNEDYQEDNPELTTSYALLALQTRELAEGLSMATSIILRSSGELHLYDAQGNHTGPNPLTGEIDEEIPWATYCDVEPTKISIAQPEAGNYFAQILGTQDGEYKLEVAGIQNGQIVSKDELSATISAGETHGAYLNVSAIEGALTVMSESPRPAPKMEPDKPEGVDVGENPGARAADSLTIRETGGSLAIQDVSFVVEDLVNLAGDAWITPDRITFDPPAFDVPPGTEQTVQIEVALDPNLPLGIYQGEVVIESTNAGAVAVPLAVHVGLIPTPVMDPISNPGGVGDYTVSWGVASPDALYLVEEDISDAFANPSVVYLGPDTQVAVTGRDPGTYYYRVKTFNDQGISDWSNTESTEVGPAWKPGDGNGDGLCTEVDALMALQMTVGKLAEDLNLDVDQDGRVTERDALIILKWAVRDGQCG